MTQPISINERNRANAQNSTGPRTPEGKAKVSQNARKLGLFVSDATLIQEDPQEFAELLAGLVADYAPQGTIEYELVRQLTVATWRLRRADRMETARLDSEFLPSTRNEASLAMAASFEEEQVFLDRIYRARLSAERSFNRVYKDLEARKARRLTRREVPDELEIEMDSRHAPIVQNKPSPQPPLPPAQPTTEPVTMPAVPGSDAPVSAQRGAVIDTPYFSSSTLQKG